MRTLFVALSLLLGALPSARAQVSVSIGVPGLQIGVRMPAYPELVEVPGYPVYYAPGAAANYFFYDGLYWVYARDSWYASSWYDGPWRRVGPERVPLYLLRVPVRYYRQPPPYFRGWHEDRPPRWGEHWGRDWEQRRPGWDRWNRGARPAPAPLPAYQREYAGERYPHAPEQQHLIRSENYRHDPRESVTRQQFRPPPAPRPGPPVMQPGRPEPYRQGPPPDGTRPDDRGGPPGRGRGRGDERGEHRGDERGHEHRGEDRGEGRR
jgi:hypothetical protein